MPEKAEYAYLTIEKPGALCTLQDLGRPGYARFGISPAGAADKYALLWANRLLGNAPSASALEITLGNFSATFEQSAQVAVTGAAVNVRINGEKIAGWASFFVEAGTCIDISIPPEGVYSYLAVRHGFCEAERLGSRSITLREGLGPNAGEPYASGALLRYNASQKKVRTRKVHWQCIPNFNEELTLRLLLAHQGEDLSAGDLDALFCHAFAIDPNSNKMGVRLNGPTFQIAQSKTSLVSQGTTIGDVQLPADGQAIVLLAEHQTIGGYPRLGSVSQLDTYQLAQRRPGQTVRFRQASLEELQSELQKFRKFFF